MLSLFLALVPPQEPVQPVHELIEFGQLRHVQLLESRGGVVRFATQIEIGTMEGDHWPEGEDTCIAIFEGASMDPGPRLAVGASLIPYFTWTVRPAWHLLELGEAMVLAVVEPDEPPGESEDAGTRLRLLSFPQGQELLSVGGVDEIEDALVRDGRFDLLLRSGGHVWWVRSSDTGQVAAMTSIDLGLDKVGCATFARGGSGKELDAWAVGWRRTELFAVPFRESGTDARRTFQLAFDGGSSNDVVDVGESLRTTAWVHELRSHLAVSWPHYDHGVGKLQVVDVSADPRVLWEGRPFPEVNGDTSDQRDYGQSIAFVPDANEDGIPEILVTGPWNAINSGIDLLSGSTGKLIRRWTPGPWESTGHSLSPSEEARRVLVGGTAHQGYPEDLSQEGYAYLLDVVRMERLQTWKLSPRKH